jgi:aryl-alcohol dehydrogenase-like predicted oxidoreductase
MEKSMIEKAHLGQNGPLVGRLGYGAMVLEGYYGASDDNEAIKTIHHALDLGVTMIDTADAYGNGHNESLIGRALQGRRNDAFLCSKFGIVFDEKESSTELPTGWGFSLKVNGKTGYVHRAIDNSLKRLDTDVIDLWYAHYADPSTPIEETVIAMVDVVKSGKVRHIGLSNVTAQQVRRAHAIHPITAVQYEYSLWRREAEQELMPTLRELGIALVGWSPLGSGFLTGTVNQLEKNDFRQNNPRYSSENLEINHH